MKSFRLALQLLRREWQSGELLTLTASLILAVTTVLTITLITDRLTSGMTRESAELVGGDLVIESTREPDAGWRTRGSELGLKSTTVLLFDSVLFAGEEMQLGSIKAVTNGYPLLGKMEIKDSVKGETFTTTAIPAPGTVWADPRILDQLGIQPGDEIIFGAIKVKVDKLIIFEPDQAGSLFQFAPRLLVNQADLAAAQVLGPGSRVRYRTLFSGTGAAQLKIRLEQELGVGHRIITPNEDENRASEALSQATQYIRLSTLLTIILAAIAIALTARRYAERHRDTSAMLRCLGGQQRSISLLFGYQLLLMTVLAIGISAPLGWLLHELILQVLAPLLPVELPPPSASPWVTACSSALLLMTGFALPPLLRLSNTPPLRVLRKELNPPSLSMWLAYGLTGVSQLVLLLVIFEDISQILLIMVAATLSIAVFGWLIFQVLKKVRKITANRHSLLAKSARNLAAHGATSTTQIMAFSLTLMLMLLIAHLRGDLVDEWRLQLPDNAPNHFVFNLFPEQTEDFLRIASQTAKLQPLYPVIRGRLVAVNGDRDAITAGGDNRRELNFTWTTALPKDNGITEGQWPPQNGEISVEQEYAKRLGMKLGDSIQIDINGAVFDVKVSSLRSVEWESFSPNFYLIFSRQQLQDMPTSYITSFYLDGDNRTLLKQLNVHFPALTIIEIDNIIARMELILSQVTLSVEVILVFILLGGFAVLFATLQTTADERRHEGALLRALGASRRYIRQAYLAEFGLIGLISGLIAVTGAEALTAAIYHKAFKLEFSPSPELWLLVPVLMALVVAVAGYTGSRRVMEVSPNQLLQSG